MSENDIQSIIKMMIFVIVMGGKGGIGKSLAAQVIAAMLSQDGLKRVRMIDTDHTNSSTRSVDPEAVMARLSDVAVRGVIQNTISDLKDKYIDHVVVDTGAQEDEAMIKLLPWISKRLAEIKAILIVVRPISLSTNSQRSTLEFMAVAEELSIPTVIVRNLGQGRQPEYFLRRWHNSKNRLQSLERGAEECIMSDADTLWADEAAGFGLSLADAALGKFEAKAGDQAAEAKDVFDKDVRAWLSIWLAETQEAIAAAMVKSIERFREKSRRRDPLPPEMQQKQKKG